MKILVSGASGLIGCGLVPHLQELGHTVVPLVRLKSQPQQQPDLRQWNPDDGHLPPEVLTGIEAVVHLAGPSINGRWSRTFKQHQLTTRVGAVAALARAYAEVAAPPRVTLLVGGIGAYGVTPRPMDEAAPYGTPAATEDAVLAKQGLEFLAGLSRLQDAAAEPLTNLTRLVQPRLGMVLHPSGGALKPLLWPHRLGLGGPLGGGQQLWGWIGRTDCVRALAFCLDNEAVHGPVNVVAPEPLKQADFAKQLAAVWGRPAFWPLPGWVVRAMFGEMADLLLSSSTAVPEKLKRAGFVWQQPMLTGAVRHELRG